MKNLVKLSFLAICFASLVISCKPKTDEHAQAVADSTAAAAAADSAAAAAAATAAASMDTTAAPAPVDSAATKAPATKEKH